MVRGLLAFIVFFLSSGCEAQSVENRYISHLGNGGITYFFCPKRVGNNVNISGFIYDMTYSTQNDSVALNFSFVSDKPQKVRALILQCGDYKCEGCNVSALYCDIKGKEYEIRTTSKFAMKDIHTTFSQKEALCFNLLFDNGGNGAAMYSRSKWDKDSRKITRIIDLIEYQK